MVQLSGEQAIALDEILNTDEPVLVTGSAGTGKSVLLRELVRVAKETGEVAVAAPTGIAALNVSGLTIHSLFGFPVGTVLFSPGGFRAKGSDYFQKLKLLVIDEVSMVRVDVMDAIDRALRFHRKEPMLPFGGLKIVLFGDPYQLPPIVTREDIHASWNALKTWRSYGGKKHFFSAEVFKDAPIRILALTEIQRQSGDTVFAEVLNRIRIGRQTVNDLRLLESDSMQAAPSDEVIRVYGKNHAVDNHNTQLLTSLPGKAHVYPTVFVENPDFRGRGLGQSDLWATLPTSRNLELKVGARIIFVKNDDQSRGPSQWVNGTMGRILELGPDKLVVLTDQGRKVVVGRSNWDARELAEFDSDLSKNGTVIRTAITGWFIQFPIRLGWAITVHKSQGQTLEKAVLDFDDQYFEVGQAYVALSRVRSLDGLFFISNPKSVDILAQDIAVINFMRGAEVFPFNQRLLDLDRKTIREKLIVDFCGDLGFDFGDFASRVEGFVKSSSVYDSAQKYIDDCCALLEEGDLKRAEYRVRYVFED